MASFIRNIFNQFIVGSGGMVEGDTVFVLNYTNIIQNSVSVWLDGSLLPNNLLDQISCSITYTPFNATITFNQPVFDGQLYDIYGLKFGI